MILKTFEQDRGEQGGPASGIMVSCPCWAIPYVDLPSGNYAVGIFHDVNGNNRLDTNLFGVPRAVRLAMMLQADSGRQVLTMLLSPS